MYNTIIQCICLIVIKEPVLRVRLTFGSFFDKIVAYLLNVKPERNDLV